MKAQSFTTTIAVLMFVLLAQPAYAGSSAPDLTVQNLKLNERSQLTFQVMNRSNKSIGKKINGVTEVQIGEHTTLYNWNELKDKKFYNGRQAGTYNLGKFTGTQDVTVCTDTTDLVAESKEDNNCLTKTLSNNKKVTTKKLGNKTNTGNQNFHFKKTQRTTKVKATGKMPTTAKKVGGKVPNTYSYMKNKDSQISTSSNVYNPRSR